MDGDIFVALLNPTIALIFCAVFFILWTERRDKSHIALYALTYLCGGLCFLLQHFDLPFGQQGNVLASNALFGMALFALNGGIARRYKQRLPYLALCLLAAGNLLALSCFIYVWPSMTGRIYAVNFAFGAMLLLAATQIRPVENKSKMDWLLFGTLLLAGIQSFPRAIAFVRLDGPYIDHQHFLSSVGWVALNYTVALSSLLVALSLIGITFADQMNELRQDSVTDVLSGLLNRRGFDQEANRALERCSNLDRPAALVICDLDHFKAINDRFGHAVGDSVISAFAGCMSAMAGKGHVAARIGGEEFAVLLAGTEAKTGRLFAEGVRSMCASLAVDGAPTDLKITASFGVAERDGDEDLAALLRRADLALYEAKRCGRDCVRMARGDERNWRWPLAAQH